MDDGMKVYTTDSYLNRFLFGFANPVKNIEDADIVIFGGGADVSPELYGDTSPFGYCSASKMQDSEDKSVWRAAQILKKPCVGICRGSQFITVMNGGRLLHHISNHAGVMHNATDKTGRKFAVSSTHHQMSVPKDFRNVIAWADPRLSDSYIGFGDGPEERDPIYEVEAVLYPETKSGGVQWHPEMMYSGTYGVKFFEDLCRDLVEMSGQELESKYMEEA